MGCQNPRLRFFCLYRHVVIINSTAKWSYCQSPNSQIIKLAARSIESVGSTSSGDKLKSKSCIKYTTKWGHSSTYCSGRCRRSCYCLAYHSRTNTKQRSNSYECKSSSSSSTSSVKFWIDCPTFSFCWSSYNTYSEPELQ